MQSRQAVLAQFIFGGSALLLAFDTPLAELDGAPDVETQTRGSVTDGTLFERFFLYVVQPGISYGTDLNCSNFFSPTTA